MGNYKKLGEEIGNVVDEKNSAYGNSFKQCQEFLTLLYPNGVPVRSYRDMIIIIRMIDKMKRLAEKPKAFSEDPYRDMAGLAIRLFLNQKETNE